MYLYICEQEEGGGGEGEQNWERTKRGERD